MIKRLYIVILMLMFGVSTAWAGSYNVLNPRYGQTAHPTEHIVKCSIDTSKIGAVGGVVTNFPVLVDTRWITQYDSLESATDRADVHFVSSTWGALKFERETGNKNIYHVLVPAPYTASYFYMCYGDQTRTDEADPTAVWDANFVMVQHMADSTTSVTSDATSNGNIGTKKGANEPLQAAGKIGYGQTFDGSDDYIDIADKDDWDFASTYFTISFDVKHISLTLDDFYLYITHTVDGSNRWQIFYANQDNNGMGFYSAGGSGVIYYSQGSETGWVAGTWYHVDVIRNGSAWSIYRDNELIASTTSAATLGTLAAPLTLGRNAYEANYYFYGVMDEVRISDTARSAAWIKADYNSGNGTLLSFTTVK